MRELGIYLGGFLTVGAVAAIGYEMFGDLGAIALMILEVLYLRMVFYYD